MQLVVQFGDSRYEESGRSVKGFTQRAENRSFVPFGVTVPRAEALTRCAQRQMLAAADRAAGGLESKKI
jgi:hypothetical protein